MDGWRLVREKLTKMPMKCIVTGQAGVFAVSLPWVGRSDLGVF